MSEVVYAIEKLHQWRRDAEPLLPKWQSELTAFADLKLDIDWGWYDKMEATGQLVVYTARTEGELAGFALFFVSKSHPRYRGTMWAVEDILWVDPDRRGQGIGRKLFDFIEDDLKQRGVGALQVFAKTNHPQLAKLLEARGYVSDEANYTRRL